MTAEQRQWLSQAKSLLQDLAERNEDFDEVRCEFLVYRLLQMWNGEEHPIGKGAARLSSDLSEMATQAAASVRIGSRMNEPSEIREPLVRILQSYAKDHYLEPVPGRVAHCICRPNNAEDLKQAECLKLKSDSPPPWREVGRASAVADSKPDFAFTNRYVCLRCVLGGPSWTQERGKSDRCRGSERRYVGPPRRRCAEAAAIEGRVRSGTCGS
jgi:hypothetical protein